MPDKLGRAEWGYIAQYETKIYFEKLEEENASIKELEVSSCQCREHTTHQTPQAKNLAAFDENSQLTKSSNLLQARIEELEKQVTQQEESILVLKKDFEETEAMLNRDLKAAQRETITAREMAVEERKTAVQAKKEAAVHTAPLSTHNTQDLQ